MKQWFGKVVNRRMQLNDYGNIVVKQWIWLQEQYPYVTLDKYIVMPNHMHGIVVIKDYAFTVGTTLGLSLQNSHMSALSKIVCAFKTTSSKLIHQNGFQSFQWQRSFYDHIIRNETSLNSIRNYITYNPYKWEIDEYNPERYFNY
jgi:REP element-mobilizing transposase RayT